MIDHARTTVMLQTFDEERIHRKKVVVLKWGRLVEDIVRGDNGFRLPIGVPS